MGNPRILILDDEKEIACLIGILLERSGYETETCLSGEEAVRLFREAEDTECPFSLLIMDLTIPLGMGGKETLNAIKEIRADIPSIATSGYDAASAGAVEAGFTHFVNKPFDIAGLRLLVQEILNPTD